MSNNPLLTLSTYPNYAPAFDLIRTEHFMPAVKEAIREARSNVEKIKDNSDTPDFENTIVALEIASETLGTVTSVFYNMLSAMGGDELHELAEEIGPINADFSNDVILDEALFKRVQSVYDRRDAWDLTPEQKMLLDDTYKSFVRGGALLDPEKKKRLREISQELSVLSPAFMNNVSKSAEEFELYLEQEDDLKGLPESAIEAAKYAASEKGHEGKWLFTLDFPSYMPFIKYADNRALREKIWRGFADRAWRENEKYEYDNSENILKIIRLRHERSNLLGYETHAQFVLERRMAENPETVTAFLEKLKTAYKPAAKNDFETLQDFVKELEGPEELKPWDVGYYSEKLKQKLFDFSSEDLRPYFPLETVLDGCFEHFSKLFDLRFEPSEAYPVWHKDVKVFEVWNSTDESFVGTLYTDFHPREGKKPGAWKTGFRSQGLFNSKVERPLISIVCNFTKPTPERPSLLTHNEVTTLFHEMGHAIHGLLSKVTYGSLGGTNVLWDFVELPSQVQENWCYERETLDLISGHYKTSEKIPAELINKLKAAKNFMAGMAGLRQISFGILDMAWYTENPESIKNVAAFEDRHTADVRLFPRLAGPASTSFSHIFAGGYAAGYYSYKWAEVLSADTFEIFLEKGLYDRATADAYKNEILTKGGSEHPRILYHRFRGCDADPDALLRQEGLLADRQNNRAA